LATRHGNVKKEMYVKRPAAPGGGDGEGEGRVMVKGEGEVKKEMYEEACSTR
jgi:hypothetical protein